MRTFLDTIIALAYAELNYEEHQQILNDTMFSAAVGVLTIKAIPQVSAAILLAQTVSGIDYYFDKKEVDAIAMPPIRNQTGLIILETIITSNCPSFNSYCIDYKEWVDYPIITP